MKLGREIEERMMIHILIKLGFPRLREIRMKKEKERKTKSKTKKKQKQKTKRKD